MRAHGIIIKYRYLSVYRWSIVCRSLQLWQIIDLLATDKSGNFAEPEPMIVSYLLIKNIYTKRFHLLIIYQLWFISVENTNSKWDIAAGVGKKPKSRPQSSSN